MIPNILLPRCKGQGNLQALLPLLQLSPLHVHHAQVVLTLHVLRVDLQYPNTE